MPAPEWKRLAPGTAYRCQVFLVPQEGGAFSVQAARLPSIVCHGKTEQEALDGIRKALEKAIGQYVRQGKPIPWSDVPSDPGPKAKSRWIVVKP
jgi:predicted RNase H-like HicB family nuclease